MLSKDLRHFDESHYFEYLCSNRSGAHCGGERESATRAPKDRVKRRPSHLPGCRRHGSSRGGRGMPSSAKDMEDAVTKAAMNRQLSVLAGARHDAFVIHTRVRVALLLFSLPLFFVSIGIYLVVTFSSDWAIIGLQGLGTAIGFASLAVLGLAVLPNDARVITCLRVILCVMLFLMALVSFWAATGHGLSPMYYGCSLWEPVANDQPRPPPPPLSPPSPPDERLLGRDARCVAQTIYWVWGGGAYLLCALITVPTLLCTSKLRSRASKSRASSFRARDSGRRTRFTFTMPPRAALGRLWLALRLLVILLGLEDAISPIIEATIRLDELGVDIPFAFLRAASATVLLLCGILASPSNRQRVHRKLHDLSSRGEVSSAAHVAALVGLNSPDQALQMATASFTGLPFEELSRADLVSNEDTGLHRKVRECKLGGVDAFVSHSWRDNGDSKWRKLNDWARDFRQSKGRTPLLWLDKACINQQAIEDSLACLPIYLAGCQTLLVLAGSTYGTRLWCVLELFTFLRMGGDPQRIVTIPVTSVHDGQWAEQSQPQAALRGRKGSVSQQTVLADRPPPFGAQNRLPRLPRMPSVMNMNRSLKFLPQKKRLEMMRRSAVERVHILDALVHFRAEDAQCFNPEDRQRLLAVIESSYGDFDKFNTAVRSIFAGALGEAMQNAIDAHEERESMRTFTRGSDGVSTASYAPDTRDSRDTRDVSCFAAGEASMDPSEALLEARASKVRIAPCLPVPYESPMQV